MTCAFCHSEQALLRVTFRPQGDVLTKPSQHQAFSFPPPLPSTLLRKHLPFQARMLAQGEGVPPRGRCLPVAGVLSLRTLGH